jgi:hypothetical protein
MTIDEACEYVRNAEESESEHRAEYGMGAVSLGYNGSEVMAHYDGYRACDDPTYCLARKIVRERYEIVQVIKWTPYVPSDSIPF